MNLPNTRHYLFVFVDYMATRKQYLSKLKSWKNPSQRTRKSIYRRCGSKCFLGTRRSFPICNRCCRIHEGAVQSAYIRAREMARLSRKRQINTHHQAYYNRIASKAKKLI